MYRYCTFIPYNGAQIPTVPIPTESRDIGTICMTIFVEFNWNEILRFLSRQGRHFNK